MRRMSKLGVTWGPERVFLEEGTASAKAERRERRWLIPETEISPVRIGKNLCLPARAGWPTGSPAANLSPPSAHPRPPGAAARSEVIGCRS